MRLLYPAALALSARHSETLKHTPSNPFKFAQALYVIWEYLFFRGVYSGMHVTRVESSGQGEQNFGC
jgi:hypothetical protein